MVAADAAAAAPKRRDMSRCSPAWRARRRWRRQGRRRYQLLRKVLTARRPQTGRRALPPAGNVPGILELVDSAEDLKLAHRLDDGTSGCLVLAKGRRAAAAIGDAFAAKRVAKVYVGLTASRPSKKKGVIVGDMVRSRRSQWRLTRNCANPACTWLSRSIGLGPGAEIRPRASSSRGR